MSHLWLRSYRKRLVGPALGTFVLAASYIALPAEPALAYPCTNIYSPGHPDAGDFGPSGSDGVNSQIYVPAPSVLGNLNGEYSDADIYISVAGGGFVQFGWYYGHVSTGLPKKSTTWSWWGDALPGQQEHLHPIAPIAQGWHNFRILRTASGIYNFYLDGAGVTSTTATHGFGQASFNAETWYGCTVMDGWAKRNPSPPSGTLWYHSTAGWFPWPPDVYFWPTTPYNCCGYNSVTQGGQGSDWAYGGG